METRGRKPGALVRCKCDKCGAIELRGGRNSNFLCTDCQKDTWLSSPQAKAHRAVAVAIRSGVLRSARCFACADCGKPATEYEHRDYSKPLEVDPICRGCNLRRGPAKGHTATRFSSRKAARLILPANPIPS